MAHALTAHADLAHDLRTVADGFPQAPTPKAALHALDRTRYTRLNSRYRAAHTWARLLLRGGGVTDILTDQGYTANGLLLAMPALWEAVVRRLATDATDPHGGHIVSSSGATGITVRGDLGNPSTFRPDVLLSIPRRDPPARALLPLDAKYKRYDQHAINAGDVHQLLTYSAGYTASTHPQAVIIHPSPAGPSHRTLRISSPQGTLGSIHVLGIDTHAPPQQAAQWIRSALPWPQ